MMRNYKREEAYVDTPVPSKMTIQHFEHGSERAAKSPLVEEQSMRVKLHRGLLDLRSPPDPVNKIVHINYEQCYLLRLPLELRMQVYRILIGARHIHIIPLDGNIKSRGIKQRYVPNKAHNLCAAFSFPRRGSILKLQHFTPIWRVCRQLYHEASVFLYTDNVFSFQTTPVATAFFDALKPAQTEALRVIGLPGLKELHAIRLPCLKRLTGLKRVELQRTPREREHVVRKLAAAFPGKPVDVVYLSEQTITEVRKLRRLARNWS